MKKCPTKVPMISHNPYCFLVINLAFPFSYSSTALEEYTRYPIIMAGLQANDVMSWCTTYQKQPIKISTTETPPPRANISFPTLRPFTISSTQSQSLLLPRLLRSPGSANNAPPPRYYARPASPRPNHHHLSRGRPHLRLPVAQSTYFPRRQFLLLATQAEAIPLQQESHLPSSGPRRTRARTCRTNARSA